MPVNFLELKNKKKKKHQSYQEKEKSESINAIKTLIKFVRVCMYIHVYVG